MRRLPLLALLLCAACLPKWFVEVAVPDKQPSASAARGRLLLLNKSFLKTGIPLRLTSSLYPASLQSSDSPVMLGGGMEMTNGCASAGAISGLKKPDDSHQS